jgi:hypothetical protein
MPGMVLTAPDSTDLRDSLARLQVSIGPHLA